jgi:hypothetical protein
MALRVGDSLRCSYKKRRPGGRTIRAAHIVGRHSRAVGEMDARLVELVKRPRCSSAAPGGVARQLFTIEATMQEDLLGKIHAPWQRTPLISTPSNRQLYIYTCDAALFGT